jgi:hypothetical protein
LSTLKTFEHEGLGGTVYYGTIPSFAMHRYENIEQYYPLDHPDPKLRGMKSSTSELDELNRERLLLRYGVRAGDGKMLDDATVEWLLKDEVSGPDNRRLTLAILTATWGTKDESATPESRELNLVTAHSRWEAAFHDLLVKSGFVAYWVEYVTSNDLSTPEAREAVHKLAKLEAAAPEWARQLQAEKITQALMKEDG